MVGSCVLQCQMRSWRRTSRNLTRIKNCYHYTPIWWLPPNHQFSCDTFFSMIERYDKPRPLLSGANFIYRFLPYSEAGHKQWWIIMIKLQYAAYSHADRLILWCLRKKISSRNQICQHSNQWTNMVGHKYSLSLVLHSPNKQWCVCTAL